MITVVAGTTHTGFQSYMIIFIVGAANFEQLGKLHAGAASCPHLSALSNSLLIILYILATLAAVDAHIAVPASSTILPKHMQPLFAANTMLIIHNSVLT